MRWSIVVLVVAVSASLLLGLTATVPVGVSAQDVQEEVASVQAAAPDASVQSAVEAATKHLEAAQRRRVVFLFAAYVVMWAVLGTYLLFLGRRQQELERELAHLHREAQADPSAQPER